MNILRKILITLLILIAITSCEKNNVPKKNIESKKNNIVTVSILPQKAFVDEIAQGELDVKVLVGPGQSPATYEPLPNQMLDLGKSSLFLRIGVPFEESFMKSIKDNFHNLKIVDTRKNIKLREFHTHDEHAEKDDEHEKHHHHGKHDPHIWLSPKLVKIQAQTIYDELVILKPSKKEFFSKNYNEFIKKLDKLSLELDSLFANANIKEVMVFHPAWGYLLDQFGIKQVPIEIEGKSPTPSQLVEIINFAKEHKVKMIFVQAQFSSQAAEALAKEVGAKVVKANPLSVNYFENLKEIAQKLTKKVN